MKHLMKAIPFAAMALCAAIPTAHAQGANAEKAQQMFAKADANGDGSLTLEEWKAAGRREQGFAMIDADKDGKVTPEELRAAAAKRGR